MAQQQEQQVQTFDRFIRFPLGFSAPYIFSKSACAQSIFPVVCTVLHYAQLTRTIALQRTPGN